MSRATRFAAVLATLHAAHNLADHVIQTDAQALGKTQQSGWAGPMAGHVGSYHAVQLAALTVGDRTLGLHLSPSRTAVAVAISAATHALLDRRWPVKYVMEATGSPGFALGTFQPGTLSRPSGGDVTPWPVPLNGPYLADQALHHAVLWVCALIASGGTR